MNIRDCLDCGVHTGDIQEYYMVTDELWAEFGEKGMLCIGCLENRMGRRLEPEDFTNCPLNTDIFYHKSGRLWHRLGRLRSMTICGG